MPCYSPVRAYEGPVQSNGKISIVWKEKESEGGVKLTLPCGKCIGCQLRRSGQWAQRCMQESSLYERNCFVTLTFNDKHFPVDGSLDVSYLQLFFKRLRKKFGSRIRYFACGEYGGRLGRPHYHSIIFNHDFDDRVLFKVTDSKSKLYTSKDLEALWPFGFSSVGDVSFASAAYVARYCIKKVYGDDSDEHYVNRSTGVLLKPEFIVMSRGSKLIGTGGIAKGWYDKYKGDVYPSDFLVVGGSKVKPPRFFDNILDKEDSDLLNELKLVRKSFFYAPDSTDDRLLVREEVKLAQIKSLKRPLEV